MIEIDGVPQHKIRLLSGGYIDFLKPDINDIHIEDIANALSKICRFGGQPTHFYSVAEHCIICQMIGSKHGFSKQEKLALLLHDATEAYLGDIPRPLKLLLPDYRAIEERFQKKIMERFNVELRSSFIKEIDTAVLFLERDFLFENDGKMWVGEKDSVKVNTTIFCMDHDLARRVYLRTYGELCS